MIKRSLNLSNYKYSLFLFGPRQTGKTSLIKTTLQTDFYIDLLKQQEFLRYGKNPSLLSREVSSLPGKDRLIVLDEIQRCPELLNEVHLLLEEKKNNNRFILTGSSARKLRRGGVNLLGGRAQTLHLYPFTHEELGELFSLEEALHYGTLPRIYLEKNPAEKSRLLKSYVETYLKEEIQQEALTRNIPIFARFLELASFENGNIINFSNLSREVGVHANTIREYFQILEDTLIGFHLYPFKKSERAKIVSHPKFYFFDTGIVTALKNQISSELIVGSAPYGFSFEHWVMVETKRILDYREKEVRLHFFRTSDKAEVDLVLEYSDAIWGIEIKAGTAPRPSDVRGLNSLNRHHKLQRSICVCQTPRAYRHDNIEFIPWRDFFKEL